MVGSMPMKTCSTTDPSPLPPYRYSIHRCDPHLAGSMPMKTPPVQALDRRSSWGWGLRSGVRISL